MFTKVLIANRGEIACRIIRTLKKMGIGSVAVYSDPDATAAHVLLADEAVRIGPAAPSESYLNVEAILSAARQTGAQAIHPGYGFLSENADFARLCSERGIEFIGPTPEQLVDFGLKHKARELAECWKVPLVPGSGLLNSPEEAIAAAEKIGYPVMLKSTAGGGGIGMCICRKKSELEEGFERIGRLSRNHFKESGLFLEKYIERARHVEVQIFGDGKGAVAILGERDCSVQRRNQKVIEETPAPNLPSATREALQEAARRLGEGVAYRSAGTVEFIYDSDADRFYFLEVNTRLQVEHGVTESVFGIDLVEWMVRLAAGEVPFRPGEIFVPNGAAMEFRIYAEDPGKNYQPSSGLVTEAVFPEGVRCDTWISAGTEVSAFYDPLLAKLIVKGRDRSDVLRKAGCALQKTRISGFETNLRLLRDVLGIEAFRTGNVSTWLLKNYCLRGADAGNSCAGGADHGSGLPGASRLLGGGGSPLRTDGCVQLPAGEPDCRQRAGGARTGNDSFRSLPPLQHRCALHADRRRVSRNAERKGNPQESSAEGKQGRCSENRGHALRTALLLCRCRRH